MARITFSLFILAFIVGYGFADDAPFPVDLPDWANEAGSEAQYVIEFAYAETATNLPVSIGDTGEGESEVSRAPVVTEEFLAEAEIVRVGVMDRGPGFVQVNNGASIFYNVAGEDESLNVRVFFLWDTGRGEQRTDTLVNVSDSEWTVIASHARTRITTAIDGEIHSSGVNFYLAMRVRSQPVSLH